MPQPRLRTLGSWALAASLASFLVARPSWAQAPELATTPSPAATAPAPAAAPTPAATAHELATTPSPAATAPAPAAPYTLPWQLRPAAAGNVVRSDTAIASYEGKDASGNTVKGTTTASLLLASYKVTNDLAPLVRLGFVQNSPPVGASGSAFLNPLVGATWAHKLGDQLRFAGFLAASVPVGQGGGDTPKAEVAAATKAGISARSAMDNAMFAVNYFTVVPGVDLAWVAHGVTLQGEATVLQLTRVRGEKASPDASNTNFTTGLHAGYFLIPQLSVGGELRYQRWLSTPASLKDAAGNVVAVRRDNSTVALGLRGHFKLAGALWLRPGIAYARALDKPMTDATYNIVQIDVAFAY